METRQHRGHKIQADGISHLGRVHVVVDLELGEPDQVIGSQTNTNTTVPVTSGRVDTGPVLDLGQNEVDQLVNELVCLGTVHGRLDTSLVALADLPLDNVVLGLGDLRDVAADGLDDRTGDLERSRRLGGRGDEGVQRYGQDFRNGPAVDVLLQHVELASTSRPAEGTVLVVRRGVVPCP